jgi:hypothetical protein
MNSTSGVRLELGTQSVHEEIGHLQFVDGSKLSGQPVQAR